MLVHFYHLLGVCFVVSKICLEEASTAQETYPLPYIKNQIVSELWVSQETLTKAKEG